MDFVPASDRGEGVRLATLELEDISPRVADVRFQAEPAWLGSTLSRLRRVRLWPSRPGGAQMANGRWATKAAAPYEPDRRLSVDLHMNENLEACTRPEGRPGGMVELVKAFDWASTPLGHRLAWPERLKAVTDLIGAHNFPMIALWGPDLIQIYNDGYQNIMGAKHPSGLGQPTRECWPEVWHINEPIYKRVLAGETLTFEDKIYPIFREGSIKSAWFTLTYSPLRDEANAVSGVLVTVFETTERHLADTALRESEMRFRAFVTASSDVVYRMSPDWREMRQLDGRGFLADTIEPSGSWINQYIDPGDEPEVTAAIEHAIRDRSLFELEHRVRRADGSLGWAFSRAAPILDEAGEIYEWLGAASDVTARKEAAELERLLLHELQHRVRNVLTVVMSLVRRTGDSSADVAEYQTNLSGRLVALTRTQTLLTRKTAAGVDLLELVHDELRAQGVDESRLKISGPCLQLAPKAAEVLTLAVHELATNAVKYGALSMASGRLEIDWRAEEREGDTWLTFVWRESGVAMMADAPRRKGFGTELVTRRVPYELRGKGVIDFGPNGVHATITFPLLEGASILQTDAGSSLTAFVKGD